jgi:hypothetical protein
MMFIYASILGVMSILAAAADPAAGADGGGVPGDWIGYLLQGGPFAVVVILFIFEKLITPGERDRLREENKKYQQDIADLNLVIREQIIPLLGQNNETMKKVYEELTLNEKIRQRGS